MPSDTVDLDMVRSALAGRLTYDAAGNGRYRMASVLVVIYGSEPRVIMTVKPRSLRLHAGEVSFPGGKSEEGDADLLDTALRETREEIGLEIGREQVTGRLDDVITLNSGFRITPLVAVVDGIPPLSANREVQEILRIPLEPFLGTMEDDHTPEHRSIGEMYTFMYRGKVVWGASARILRQIVKLVESR